MPRAKPEADNATHCVSVSKYFTTRIEAEAEFDRMKDAMPDVAIDFWEKDGKTGDWVDTEWSGYPDGKST